MPVNSNDLSINIVLNLEPLKNNVNAAIAFLKTFQTSAEDIMNLKPDADGLNKVITGLENTKNKLGEVETATKGKSTADKEALASVDKHGATLVNLQDKMQQIALRYQGFISILSILKGTFGNLINDYKTQEIALSKLQQGLKNVGEGTGAIDKLVQQSSNLQKITPFTDEDINNAQATLTTFQKSSEEINILIPRVLDLAAARMQDGDAQVNLMDIARILGKVNEENLQVLKRYGIIITDTDEKMLKSLKGTQQAEYLAGLLEKRVGGMAESIGNTAAGKIKIFHNQIGEVKEGLGKIISEGLIPFLNIFKPIIEWIGNAPTPVKILTLALIGLSAAFAVLNTSMGYWPYIIGGAVAGVIALVTSLNERFEDLKKSVNETHTEIDNAAENINNLKQLQTEFANSSTLTAEEQSKLNAKLQEAANLHPELVTGIDAQTGAMITTVQAIQEVIDKEEALQQLRRDVALNDQIKQIDNLIKQHDSEIESQQRLEQSIESLKQVREGYMKVEGDYLSYIGSDLILYNEKKADAIKRVDERIVLLSKDLLESGNAVKKLELNFAEAIASGLKFGNINKVINHIQVQIAGNTQAMEIFKKSFTGLSAIAAAEMLGIQNTFISNATFLKQWTAVFIAWKKALLDGNEAAANIAASVLATMTKIGSAFVKKTDDTAPKPKKTTGQIKEQEEKLKLVDEEKKKLDELNQKLELNAGDRGAELEILKEIEKVQERIIFLQTGERPIKEMLNELDADKSTQKIKEELIRRSKEIAENQKKIDLDIRKLKIEAIEEEYKKRRAQIELTYDMELKKIEEIKDASDEQLRSLQELTKGKKDKELKKVNEEEQLETFNKIKTIAEQIQNIFQFGSHTIFASFLKALQITEQIVSLLKSLEAVGSIFSFLSSIFGFIFGGPTGTSGAVPLASGGIVPGSGNSDSVPALLTPGEFVIRKSRVQEIIHQYGTSFLSWLNGGGLISSISGHYNSGGFVAKTAPQVVRVEVVGGKLKGQDIYLNVKRLENSYNKRIK